MIVLQVYEEIRNRHFSDVSSFLSEKAKALQSGYDVSMCCLLMTYKLMCRVI